MEHFSLEASSEPGGHPSSQHLVLVNNRNTSPQKVYHVNQTDQFACPVGSKPISHKQPTILSDVGSTNEATDAISILNVDKVHEIKIFSEDETSNSAKEHGL